MFGIFRKKTPQPEPSGVYVTARLNARVQPIDRGEFFEDPLDDKLRALGLGEVTGGGTQLADEPAGIEFCDLEVLVTEPTAETLQTIANTLNSMGAPKGSRLLVDGMDEELPFGVLEGLALFLNGTDLPQEVYESSDVNFVIAECERLMGGDGAKLGHWQGSRETGLYFYGPSFDEMSARIAGFVADYPLCRKSRIERIA